MATADGAYLHEEVEVARARVAELRSKGKVSGEVYAVFGVLFKLLVAVLPERTTRKAGRNSGIPPSHTEEDGTARRLGTCGQRKAAPPEGASGRQP